MLKELRMKKNLTQAELAEKIGIGFSYLSKLENHPKTQNPSLDLILRISDVLGLDICQLLHFYYADSTKKYDTLVTCNIKKRTYNKLAKDAEAQDKSISDIASNIMNEYYKK